MEAMEHNTGGKRGVAIGMTLAQIDDLDFAIDIMTEVDGRIYGKTKMTEQEFAVVYPVIMRVFEDINMRKALQETDNTEPT
jgi:hypothetical protein